MDPIERYSDDERRYTLVLDVRYGAAFNRLQSRLYAHALTALSVLQIAAGSAAVVSVVSQSAVLATLSGIGIAALGAIGAVIDVGGRAARFDDHRRRFAETDAIASTLDLDDLGRRVSTLQGSGPAGEVDALAQPAYNENLRTNGRGDALVPLRRWERLLYAFA